MEEKTQGVLGELLVTFSIKNSRAGVQAALPSYHWVSGFTYHLQINGAVYYLLVDQITS